MGLNEFAASVNKRHGKGTIVKLNDASASIGKDGIIPTGSLSLDAALGIGGYARGKLVEIIGNPSCGKTTLALHAIAEANLKGLNALYIDAEHALDPLYAESIGVNLDMVSLSQPDYGEQALQVAEEGIASKEFGIIVIDSVAALAPKRELDGEVGDSHVGLQARMMSQACRKMTAIAHTHGVLVIFINQYRANIATTGYGGESKIAAGGNALGYYASVIVDVARIQRLKSGDEITGNRTKATVKKNKLGPPYRTAEFDIAFGIGIDKHGEVIDYAEEFGIIKKSGAWYKSQDGTVNAQGRVKLISYLVSNPDVYNLWRSEVEKKLQSYMPQPDEVAQDE